MHRGHIPTAASGLDTEQVLHELSSASEVCSCVHSWQVRQRYREASDVIKKGKLCSLFINDLDAGAVPLPDGHSVYRLCQKS